jgi:protein YIPF6
VLKLCSDDDDEFDEDAIPGYSLSPAVDKGKRPGPPPEQLAPPGTSSSASGLSGSIGSAPQAGQTTRKTVGGVRVETRSFHPIFGVLDIHRLL